MTLEGNQAPDANAEGNAGAKAPNEGEKSQDPGENDQNEPVNGQNDGKKEVSLETLNERIGALEQENSQLRIRNDRMFNESTSNKRKAKEFQEKYLKETKNTEELLAIKEQENKELKEENQKIQNEVFERDVMNLAAKEAVRRGCEHYDQLLALGDTEMIQRDQNTGQIVGIDRFFDIHQNKPEFNHFFYKKRIVPVNSNTPGLPKDQEQLSFEKDPTGYLEELRVKDYPAYQKRIRQLNSEGKLS